MRCRSLAAALPMLVASVAVAGGDGDRRNAAAEERYAVVATPFGIDRGACDRQGLSQAMAALSAGVWMEAEDPAAADSTGAGRSDGSAHGAVDAVDRHCVAHVLEYAPDRRTVDWEGADGRVTVTPERTFRTADDLYCRRYRTTVAAGAEARSADAVACRHADGSWRPRR